MQKKNYLYLFLAGCVLTALPLSARTVYVTRHGQVDGKTRVSKKVREPALTELGQNQAQALAAYLVEKRKFNGKIYVSPFYRTIQTGVAVGERLKTKVILEPGLQEVAQGPRPSSSMDLVTIRGFFPEMTFPGKRYKDPWRLFAEDGKKRNARVVRALEAILAEEKGDILLVGHGGIIGPLVNVLNKKRISSKVQWTRGHAWNCALYIFELDENNRTVKGSYTTEYMADKDLTSNFRCPKIERPDDPRYERKKKTDTKKSK